uniref:MADS-box domain-containing protein n=1 Tax=Oryza punctata TaxID=4537 RepID=A0A0E0LWN3_ORYPU
MRRGKVKIKPITNRKARDVCFSKRRQVVIKKANELSILCGVNVAVALLSPAGKPFFFGCPTVQAVTRRLLGVGPYNPAMGDGGDGDETDILHELNLKYQQLQQENEVENKKNQRSQDVRLASDVNVLGLHELEAFDSNLNAIDDIVDSNHVIKNAKQTAKPQPEMNVESTLQFTLDGQRIAPSV